MLLILKFRLLHAKTPQVQVNVVGEVQVVVMVIILVPVVLLLFLPPSLPVSYPRNSCVDY